MQKCEITISDTAPAQFFIPNFWIGKLFEKLIELKPKALISEFNFTMAGRLG